MGDHIRLTTIDEDRDIVEILHLAMPPCHSSRQGANSSSIDQVQSAGATALAQVEALTQLVEELSKNILRFMCLWREKI